MAASEGQLQLFKESLPRKPYCSDDLTVGLRIRPQQQAIRSRYVQHNRPKFTAWIVLDVDRRGAAWDWYDRDAPAPNITAENPKNGHAHLFYGLETPVYTDPLNGSQKALRYAAAIEHGLLHKLSADPSYRGLISKNPLHKSWRVITFEQFLYDLDWLADFVELPQYEDRRRRMPDYGLGRNCTLFDLLRRWAYREVKHYWNADFESFYTAVEIEAALRNNREFDTPMMWAEVKHIVKSVAHWTWEHFTPEKFSEIQRARKLKDSVRRRKKAEERAQRVFQFMQENPKASIREIAQTTGISKSAISRYKEDSGLLSDMVRGTVSRESK